MGLLPNGDLNRSISIWDAASETRIGQAFVNGEFSTGKINHRILAGIDMTNKNYYADFYQIDTIASYDEFYQPLAFNIYQPQHHAILPGDQHKWDRETSLRERGFGTIRENSSSFYIQDEIRFLNDKLRITIAGRHTTINQESFGITSDDNAFTPRAGVSYSLNKWATIYGLYDKTFLAQQGADSSSKPYVPVTGTNLEAGLKSEWGNGKWHSTLSLYHITRNNVINIAPVPGYATIQTGQIKTRGVEIDLNGELAPGLSLIFNYSFSEAEVTKDADASKIGARVPGPSFPKHISNTWLSYKIKSGKLGGAGAAVGYQYLGGRIDGMNDYFRTDANISWENESIRLSLNANNVFNRYLYSGAPFEYNNDFSSPEYYYQIEPGINFRLGAAFKF